MPLIVIRTAGGPQIGLGHVRRTLTLAQALRRAGAAVTFLLEGREAAAQSVRHRGFDVIDVTGDPERGVAYVRITRPAWIVLDMRHASGDLPALREAVNRLGVIDDLGQPPVEADLVTNSAIYAPELPYRRRPGAVYLLGPAYALLREEFVPEPPPCHASPVKRIVITLGGSDPAGLTPQLVRWVRADCPDADVIVVAGPFFNNLEEIRAAGPDDLLVNPPQMRGIMAEADLAVSGGGQTTYELAATGRPVIAIQVADDQRRNLEGLHRAGVLVFVGAAADTGLQVAFRRHLRFLAADAETRARMGRAGRAMVDGQGADRVAAAVVGLA